MHTPMHLEHAGQCDGCAILQVCGNNLNSSRQTVRPKHDWRYGGWQANSVARHDQSIKS